jgi:hypothetical protein
MKKSLPIRLAIITSSLLALAVVFVGIWTPQANALSGAEFKAGNITDDAIFFNKNSMSTDQIQTFLNSKVPSCDTWGSKIYSGNQTRAQYGSSKGNPAPYTCLRDYSQNTPSKGVEPGLCDGYGGGQKSSAQIIYDVAQSCGVSPKVLLVLLQKEQSLISDDWPWPIQYRSATGFGCPDTAPCDSEYYGFFNQVYNAARIYKKYARDASLYNFRVGRNNNVLYHPNGSCGSSSVYLENQATTGLYTYTPYQPNQSALNNLYGTGDGCSAYGNRNYWRMYNDWFGSTHGALIRTAESGSLYYSDGERRYYIPDAGFIHEYGLGAADVRIISQQELNALPLASGTYSNSLGYVIKSSSSDTLYLVSGGSKIPITSMSAFTNLGFTNDMIRVLSPSVVNRLYTSTSYASPFIRTANGAVYKIESGKRRAIFEQGKLNAVLSGQPINNVTYFIAQFWNFGNPLVDGNYVAIGPTGSVRLYNGASYSAVRSMSPYNCWALSGIKTFRLSTLNITNGTEKESLTCFGKDSSNNVFVMSGNKRIQLSSSVNIQTSSPSDSAIQRLPLVSSTPVFSNANGTLAILEQNKMRPISSMSDFSYLGYTSSSITNISNDAFSSFPQGYKALTPGAVIRSSSGAGYILTKSGERAYFGSMKILNDYNLKWPSYTSVSAEISSYTLAPQSLSNVVKTTSDAYLVDNKTKYRIDPTLDAHTGINRASLPLVDPKLLQSTSSSSLTRFIKSSNTGTIYYLENGSRRQITSWPKYLELSSTQNPNITILTPEVISGFNSGQPL